MNDKDNRTDRNKENIPAVPPGMWIKCTKCGKLIYRKELEKNKFICMKCGKYFRMPSENRILDIIDEIKVVKLSLVQPVSICEMCVVPTSAFSAKASWVRFWDRRFSRIRLPRFTKLLSFIIAPP